MSPLNGWRPNAQVQRISDLTEMVKNTPLTIGHHTADALVNVPEQVDRWLAKTSAWRAELVRLGERDVWQPFMESMREQAEFEDRVTGRRPVVSGDTPNKTEVAANE